MVMKKKAWALMVCLIGFSGLQAQDKLYPNTFALNEVTLLDGPFKHAQDLDYLPKENCSPIGRDWTDT